PYRPAVLVATTRRAPGTVPWQGDVPRIPARRPGRPGPGPVRAPGRTGPVPAASARRSVGAPRRPAARVPSAPVGAAAAPDPGRRGPAAAALGAHRHRDPGGLRACLGGGR